MNDAQTLIATLQSAPRIIIGLIREVPPQYLKRRPSPTKWSVHEHACHISTADTAYLLRLELILSDPAPYIKSMLPSADEEAGSLLNIDLDEALDLYVRERARLVERLKELSEGDWQRTARHEVYSHYSVFIMFRDLLAARVQYRGADAKERLVVRLRLKGQRWMPGRQFLVFEWGSRVIVTISSLD